MNTRRRFVACAMLLLFCCVPLAMAGDQSATRPAREAEIVQAANRFAIDLYKGAAREATDGRVDNLVISPYCTTSSLTVLREAAAGRTALALQKLLGLSADLEADRASLRGTNDFLTGRNATGTMLVCNIAHGFCFDRGVTPTELFLSGIKSGLGVEMGTGDFEGAPDVLSKKINEWVARQTRGKITDLCTPASFKGKQADLISAIYFHGKWIHPFKEEETHDADFHVAAGRRAMVKMMRREAVSNYYRGEGVQLTAIPYYTNEPSEGVAFFQFVLVLPDDPNGLAKLEQKLNLATLERWIRASDATPDEMEAYFKRKPADDAGEELFKAWAAAYPRKEVSLAMPRFGTQTRQRLGNAMKSAGAADVFGSSADFSRMGVRGFHVDELLQVARIDVDEKGTEAAAAQEYGLFGGSSGVPVTVTADHPFLYLIRESTTGMILFLGRVGDPSRK
jgi:serpin B